MGFTFDPETVATLQREVLKYHKMASVNFSLTMAVRPWVQSLDPKIVGQGKVSVWTAELPKPRHVSMRR